MAAHTATYDPTARVPPAIRGLMIVCGAAYALQLLFDPSVTHVFGLRPAAVLERGWVWQPVSYLFLHGGLLHLVLNMLVLWMFGTEIERLWGSRAFLGYYFICGLGAAALSFLLTYQATIIGASGAVLGVLLAFGVLFPDRTILVWFVIPIRAKYLVAGLAVLELLYVLSARGGPMANAAHLGGMATGFLYLMWRGDAGGPFQRLRAQWRRRHLQVHEGGPPRPPGDAGTEAKIDRILDKISEQGLDSLTPEESRLLDDASRRRPRS
ncbi:MAG: rhomboid family intramembrane serine protease [Gemmatimonadota bacterium]